MNKIVNSVIWKLMERLSVQGINLIVQIVLARILFPSDFGSLAIVVAIVNYASIFVQSGLSTAIVQKKEIDDLDINTLFTASTAIAGVLYVALFFLSPWIARMYELPHLVWGLRCLGVVLFLNAINSIQNAIYSRRMNFKRIFRRTLIAVIVSGIVGIVMATLGCGIWALIVHNIVNVFVLVVALGWKSDFKLRFRFSWKSAKKLYAFSVKILITSIITGLYDILRTMMIGKYYSSDDLAYYDKAYTYSGYVTNISTQTITGVLLPTFSQAQDKKDELKSMARTSTSITAFIMLPLLLGIASIANEIVLLLLTEKWVACVPFLVVFCVLRLPATLVAIDRQIYYALDRSGINLIYEIFFCTINILLLLVTLRHNVYSVAIGAMIVEFVGIITIFIASHKIYGYRISERISDIWKPTLAALFMALVLFFVRNIVDNLLLSLIIKVCVGVAVYVSTLSLLRDKNMIYFFNKTVSKIVRK